MVESTGLHGFTKRLQEGAVAIVARGEFGGGLRWEIEAGGSDQEFSTMLMVYRGGQLVEGSGMGGPKLYPARPVNVTYGMTDDLPCSEVVRADPSIDRIVVTTDRGLEVELELTGVIEEFGLRFGAIQLPDGHLPDELRAEAGGEVVYRETQHGLRRRPGRGGLEGPTGWRPTSDS